MKFLSVSVAALIAGSANAFSSQSAFTAQQIGTVSQSSSSLQMVLEKPATKKISKLEQLKVASGNLVAPLKEVSEILFV